MKYLKYFEEVSAYETYKNGSDYVLPNVSYVVQTGEVSYNPYVPDMSNYLTIEALEDGLTASLSINACEYCVDGGSWKTLSVGTATEAINTGQTLSFRGNLTPASNKGIGTFTITKKCNLKGNCMSMLFGDDAASNTSLSGKDYAFYKLFYNGAIINVSSNFLPATTLAVRCYDTMFYGCGWLTTAPELPATTLADYCYSSMFNCCHSLTTAPELPATSLANSCYDYMFADCYSLTTAPELPATTLTNSCYNCMFKNCYLTTAPELPATNLANNCYYHMFNGCTSLTTAPELPATTLTESCYGSMFKNCTNLTTAPELPATTLTNSCYSYMFNGCTNLTTASALPATTLADYCYSNMFNGCTNLTTAPALPATALVKYCYSGMFKDCTNLNYIKMLATDISGSGCLNDWVNNIASTGTFVKNPAMYSLPTANKNNKYAGIPSGWTTQNAA